MSAQNYSLLGLCAIASAAVTANTFVGWDNATATAAGNAKGVARSDAALGAALPVDIIGTAVVKATGAIADGDALEVGANGTATVKSAGVTVARALQSVADGELCEVLLIAN
ncbi:DUF2190 family protein [Gallaecimonas kandeliae]|uniref:capsid cement protein n=1 Tax=Gallaecimonas kandeliae TaxID=3029055 RepID=UPI002647C20F|nr:capsid cement protein [Gallaecimonas kandeliae]WKE65067.1 DUF2190 family protein [Gallaecimonas kandeliae]